MELPFPQIMEEIVAVARLVPPVQRVVGEILEKNKDIRHQRRFERIVEQTVDVPFPYALEEKVEDTRLVPQERFQQRIVEGIVEILIPQIQEQSVAVPRNMLLKCSRRHRRGTGVGTHGRRDRGGGTHHSSGAVDACRMGNLASGTGVAFDKSQGGRKVVVQMPKSQC